LDKSGQAVEGGSHFLHDQQIGLLAFYKPGNLRHLGTLAMQQIPADDLHAVDDRSEKSANQRWSSDGLEICCWNGEVVRLMFAIDTCDREIIAW
jgi:transposase InsO family protein